MSAPLQVICCPDSFKGTATALEAATALSKGVLRAGHHPLMMPFADGGEGTSAILAHAHATASAAQNTEVKEHESPTLDALGRPISAPWWQVGSAAFLDIASASGLPAVSDCLDARRASTFGSGLLLREILQQPHSHISSVTICLGGSATTDGGAGLLLALGTKLYDAEGNLIPFNPDTSLSAESAGKAGVDIDEAIMTATRVELPEWITARRITDNCDSASERDAARERDETSPRAAAEMTWQIASDVTTSPADCAKVFGPQKGASDDDVAHLSQRIEHWCQLTGVPADTRGYGAAGACPVGLSFLAAAMGTPLSLTPGAQLVADAYRLDSALDDADFLITGEGHVDKQSGLGKVVGYLVDRAVEKQISMGIVGGVIDEDAPVARAAAATYQLPGPMSETIPQLEEAGYQLATALAGREK